MTPLPVSAHALMPIAIAALVLWRVTRRVRRLVGRQPVRPGRLVFTLVFFPLLVLLLAVTGSSQPDVLLGLVGGAALGAGIGVVGLRMTRYEVTDEGLFYTPNTAIGIALALLFVGRLIYRFGTLYFASGTIDPSAFESFGKSPLTLLVFGVLAGYYIAYSIGIVLWRRSVTRDALRVERTT